MNRFYTEIIGLWLFGFFEQNVCFLIIEYVKFIRLYNSDLKRVKIDKK